MATSSETSFAGAGMDFTATAWSLVLVRKDASPDERRRQLEFLAARYWKPIFQYIRRKWRRSSEDARDLTQQFFLWMMDTDFADKIRGDKGRFRNFVKTSVGRFVSGEVDAARRLKRGGDRASLSLDFIREAGGEMPAGSADPEALLDDQWRRSLIEGALERLQQYYASQAKVVQYRVFEDFYFAPEPGPTYDELAERHGVSKVDVANYIARAKTRFRGCLEELIAHGVGGAAELRQEFEELFGAGP